MGLMCQVDSYMYTRISVLSEHFPAFPRTAFPNPVVTHSGSNHIMQCISEPLTTVDGPGMDTLGQLFLPLKFGTGTKEPEPFIETVT